LPPRGKAESPDPRYEILLQQVTRGITQQQAALDNLRARAGTLVAAAALVSSFLGAPTLAAHSHKDGCILFLVLALIALAVVIFAAFKILLPYSWQWGIDGHRLLADYIEHESNPASVDEMRRDLSYHMQDDVNANTEKLESLFIWLQVAITAIGAEVVFWSAALLLR
jgi:hypothetical protein